MKKSIIIVLIMSIIIGLCACQAPPIKSQDKESEREHETSDDMDEPEETEDNVKIGISMPTMSLQRWNEDGFNMEAQLKEAGYEVDLQFANYDPALQIAQIEDMITGGCTVLVVASVDAVGLNSVLANAKDQGITVIAYDRLLMNTDAVDYYITFDNYLVGAVQGEYIEKKLDLANAGNKVYNMEMFAGSPDDNNALFFFYGAYDYLEKYISTGTLNVVSDQTSFESIAISEWTTEAAQKRMDTLLSTYYADGKPLDVVLSPNDSLALGIANSLSGAGYKVGENFPIITGQDCDRLNVINIILGKQSMSVFKDTRDLVDQTVEMAKAVAEGKEVPVNDTKTYNNTIKIVPSFLCAPRYVDRDNYKSLLIDPGYYSEADLAIATMGLSVEEKAYTYPIGTYEEYARNPDTYYDQPVQIQCTVIQVSEFEGERDYRVITNSDFAQIWLIVYYPQTGDSRVLEGDAITVYGWYAGIITYESVGAGQVSVPAIVAEDIIIN